MTLPAYVGRFEVRGEIATGGFAVVLRAWDEELACFVALKVMRREFAANREIELRFLKEARLLRRIRSPHVVTIHDVGRLNDGRPYFVMDYADRGTLAARLERRPGFEGPDVPSVMRIVDAVADGAAAIHEAGLVHRDIKPANTLFQLRHRGSAATDPATGEFAASCAGLVSSDERILIGDLGFAKDLMQASVVTMVGGTPLYQAPEQADPAATITPAADVYAATAMLWHVLTGERPPVAGGIHKRLHALPDLWRVVIEKGMALDPTDRFDTIESWRSAIHEALSHQASEIQIGLPTEVAFPEAPAVSCPYKGLAAYQLEDARFFFGREALIEEIVRRIQLNQVLVVGGPSGSGKSSLIRAGLIPALKAGTLPGSDTWRFTLFTPGRDPMAELFFQMTRDSPIGDSRISLEAMITHPAMARHLSEVNGSQRPQMLFIDQFEELFTLAPAARRDRFISALSAMTDPADSTVRVVIAVRADFYAACAQFPWLAGRITNNQVLVGPMTKSELRRAIVEPARPMGLRLEGGLVDAIIDEAGDETGSLPLVAHALVETWNRRQGNTLTLEGFRAAGGVAGAISQTADAIFNDRFNTLEREATQRLFLRLVTPGEGTPDTRRVLARTEIENDAVPDVMQRVVESLTEARLLTVDDSSVQIAHEALLRTWPRLRVWIEASRDDLRTRQRISRAATEWDAEGRDPDLLYRGTPLLSALEWAGGNPEQLGEIERRFLDASTATKARAEALAAEKKSRTRRIRRVTIAVLASLALGATLASLAAFFAMGQARLNEKKAELATAEAQEQFAAALGVGARGMVDTDPLLALVLAVEAAARAGTQPPTYDARATLLAARKVLTQAGPFLVGGPIAAGDALSIALRPDGALLASAQRNGTIELIDSDTKQRIGGPLRGHQGGIRDVDFSPDGRWLASVGSDGALRLWSIEEELGGAGRRIGQTTDVIMDVSFSPDGASVATGNGDGAVQLWDVVQGMSLGQPLYKHALGFNVVEFSPDGHVLIASSHDGTIYGWNLPSREPLFDPITGAHTSHLLKLAYSPAGDRFATASTDGTAKVLEAPSGRIVGPAFGNGAPIGSVVFNPDGRILIGGNGDGAISLWDVAKQTTIATTPPGHSGAIVDVDLSRDGNLLATLGLDQTIRLWSFDSTHPLALERQVLGDTAKGVAFSGDGRYLAAGDDAGAVEVWEIDSAKPLAVFQGQGAQGRARQVWALAFAPDGRRLASGDRSGQIRLWDLTNATLQRTIDAHEAAIWSLAFMPDGQRLVSTDDTQVRIWNVATGGLLRRLTHQGGRNTRAVRSPDGALLAVTATDGKVRIWDLATAAITNEIKVDEDLLWSAAFSPDMRHLAVASSDETVSVWDLATGRRQAAFTGHTAGATDLAWLADGVTLAVVDRSGRLHWWDVQTQRRLAEAWPAHAGTSWRLAVHPDGRRLATAGDDGKIKVWDEFSVERACAIGKHAFDKVRRRQYLGQNERSLACDRR